MDFELSFATDFKFLAPLVAALEFFQIRVRVALEGHFGGPAGCRKSVESRKNEGVLV